MQEFSRIYDGMVPQTIYRATLAEDKRIDLDCGQELGPIKVAYATFGQPLSSARDNVVLICHAFTGDQFVLGMNPVTGTSGWWDTAVGAGKSIDTNKYHIICSNVLGGCMGTTGPLERGIDGRRFALKCPPITIQDMVKVQERLIRSLGIDRLHCVVGGSMGGMQALAWDTLFPDRCAKIAVIAAAARNSTQNIAFNEVARHAIRSDPNWHDGDYVERGVAPSGGLKTARMMAHIGYMSEEALQSRFGRRLQAQQPKLASHEIEFQVESYLNHQGDRLVSRFDALSYLYLTRAIDYFDLESRFGGDLSDAFRVGGGEYLIISFDSDWHFTGREGRVIADALTRAGRAVTFKEFRSDRGHDTFLLDHAEFLECLSEFIERPS